MSTPDQPATPPLTRRQLREIRNTGTTPVIPPADEQTREDVVEPAVAPEPAASEPGASEEVGPEDVAQEDVAPEADQPEVVEPAVVAVLAEEPELRSEPEPEAGEPGSDAGADLSGFEERLAEASVPDAPVVAPEPPHDLGVAPLTRRQAREHERIRTASVPIITPDAAPLAAAPTATPPLTKGAPDEASSERRDVIAEVPGSGQSDAEAPAPSVVVNPHLGSGLLEGEPPVVELPPSFDQLITRAPSGTGSTSTPNALILSQTPSAAPLVAPVTATGEVLITGSFDLPEGLGSVGHAPGIHDGKEADAVLVDGELPAASSPTPIAASAAISTVRSNDEIIRPPAPEKGSRLVLALALTAGALLITVAGLLVLAFTTGAL
jgi:hypothetical protein